MSVFERGSEWRKWDLHIHTPISICQKYGGEQKWDKFIEALENLPEDVKVIGITDYYFIDGYQKVMEYKKNGRLPKIEKIFPILEFRIDTFGSGNENRLQKINLHILFDVDEDDLPKGIKKIKSEFIGQIPLTKLDKHKTKMLSVENLTAEGGNDLQQGFSDLIPSTERVFELINSLTWKNKTFLFLGYKEWSNLEKNNQLKPLKEDLYDKVASFFSSNLSTIDKSQEWLNEYGKKKLLHSGDIHDFGFLDTANKDSSNNFIESTKYVCETWIKADPTFEGLKQIICEPEDRVKIQANKPEEKSGYHVIKSVKVDDNVCKQTVFLNSNLNTIIGGRSTGKSTLLQLIAYSINPRIPDITKFVRDISQKAVKIIWQDDEEDKDRDIEFFPQNHMHMIASEENKKNALIRDIVAEKDSENIIKNYRNFCVGNKATLQTNVDNLFELQSEVDELVKSLKEEGDKRGLEKEIESIKIKISDAHTSENFSEDELKEFEKLNKNILKLETTLQKLDKDKNEMQVLKDDDLFDKSFGYKFNVLSDINSQAIQEIFESVKQKATENWRKNLIDKLKEVDSLLAKNKTGITENKNLEIYIKGSLYLERNKQYKELNDRLAVENKKLTEIISIQKQIDKIEKQKNDLLAETVNNHLAYHEKISSLVNDFSLVHDDIQIKIKKTYLEDKCKELLKDFINLQSYNRQKFVNDWGDDYVSNIKDKIEKFLNRALESKIELKAYKNSKDLTKGLLTENWFSISYELTYQGDTFEKMSDGKKAFVILKLLLEFSNKKCPILIDQPEDSLDNRAIYNELVTYIKQKKKSRQIILVTHNANIVVNADAEEVIVANQHGDNAKNSNEMKFQYISGSIENTKPKDKQENIVLLSQGVREHICEILEGGTEAFKKRENKYGIQ